MLFSQSKINEHIINEKSFEKFIFHMYYDSKEICNSKSIGSNTMRFSHKWKIWYFSLAKKVTARIATQVSASPKAAVYYCLINYVTGFATEILYDALQTSPFSQLFSLMSRAQTNEGNKIISSDKYVFSTVTSLIFE